MNCTGIRILSVAALSLPIGLSSPAVAGIKCWENDQGVTECGNVVPPEYAQKGHQVKSASGITVEEQERAKTEEELERLRRQEEERKERERIAREKAERDRVLLATFTTESDLLLAKEDKLEAIDARIRQTQGVIEKLETTRDRMQAEAAQQERSGKSVSEELRRDIAEVQRQIEQNRQFIANREAEKREISASFDEDLRRYRELKAAQTE